jgi:hypothetical protein
MTRESLQRELERRESIAWRRIRTHAGVVAVSRTPKDREFNIRMLLLEIESQGKQIDAFIDSQPDPE